MSKIFVSGSTGFVGGNSARVLQNAGHEVIGLVRKAPLKPIPWQTVVDFSSNESREDATHGCQAIIHSAIASDFNRLQNDRAHAYDSFVGKTQRFTRAANENSSQIIYLPTDWVMDGSSHRSLDRDTGNPGSIPSITMPDDAQP
jgi:nucleoside-diphosphate-sugar epimerase